MYTHVYVCVLTVTACAQAHTCTSVVHVTVDHSIYACTCTQSIVSVDKEKMEVTVRAGSTLSELNSLLEEHGLAMKILGSISNQTVGGAISTGMYNM